MVEFSAVFEPGEIRMAGSGTVDEARWELLDGFGVSHGALRALEERLDKDFEVDDFGYAQFADLGDVRLRAVVSDQVLRTTHAVGDNLLLACVHAERIQELTASGKPLIQGGDAMVALRRNTELDAAVSGFFSAVPSAFDCLAGVAIGVCRAPKSITRADVRFIEPLTTKPTVGTTAAQRAAWQGTVDTLDKHRAQPPAGWFEWLDAMRNLMVHRARQQRLFLPRVGSDGKPLQSQPAAGSHPLEGRLFDFHVRQRPSLPDMQDMTRPQWDVRETALREPVTVTLPNILRYAGALIDGVAAHLGGVWAQAAATPADFLAPAAAWQLGPEPGPELVSTSGMLFEFEPTGDYKHGQLGRRLAVAEKVRATYGATAPPAGSAPAAGSPPASS